MHVGEGITPEKLGNEEAQANIRFLAYPRGRRDVGQALLKHADGWARNGGFGSILCYRQAYRYPFYHFAHAFLSNNLEHVQSLLLVNGYKEVDGEVFLDWPHMNPMAAELTSRTDLELEVEHKQGEGWLPDISIKATIGDRQVGECDCVSAATFSGNEQDEDWIFTQWLGIIDEHQGAGLGRLVLNKALCEAREAGYEHAANSTAMDNHRALLFYSNCGYTTVDWTRQFLKRF